jgi:hypothetical protein
MLGRVSNTEISFPRSRGMSPSQQVDMVTDLESLQTPHIRDS